MNMAYDVFVSFIGAFLGFAFALLSEAIISYFVRRRDIKSYLNNIRKELSVIFEVLEKHKDADDIELMFDIPIWEAFIQSGEIRYLLKKTYYTDLLNVYSKLKKANELETLNQNDEMDRLIILKRNEIFNSLKQLLSDADFNKM